MDYQLGPGPLQVDQNTIDEKIKGDIGIVENGDVATHAIPKGYYVIWKGDLYVAKTDISSGTTLSTSNLTAKPNGLGAEIATLNSKLSVYSLSSGQELLTVALDNTICPVNSIRWINPRNGSVSGGATVYGMACVHKRLDTAISVYIYSDFGTTYVNNWNSATNAWSGWDSLALNSQLANMLKSAEINTTTTANGNISLPVAYSAGVPIAVKVKAGSTNVYAMIGRYGGQEAGNWGAKIYSELGDTLLTNTEVTGVVYYI